MSFFVNRFLKGKWFAKSNSILSNRKKVLLLISTLHGYLKQGGLERVRRDLALLSGYVGDIVRGRYRDYSRKDIVLALAGIIYVVSPLDIIPDFIPFGFADDVAIITWAMTKIGGELVKYSAWKRGGSGAVGITGGDDIEEVEYEEV